jgi:hypothetical protein
MIDNLLLVRNEPTPHGRFLNTFCKLGDAADEKLIAALKDVLCPLDELAFETLARFYRRCRTFEFSWEHLGISKLDVGSVKIVDIKQLTINLRSASDDYIPFDFAEDNVVALSLKTGKMQLYLSEIGAPQEFVPLRLNLLQYFQLMNECRALFPWQKATLEATLQDEFLVDLKRLFPNANLTSFRKDY